MTRAALELHLHNATRHQRAALLGAFPYSHAEQSADTSAYISNSTTASNDGFRPGRFSACHASVQSHASQLRCLCPAAPYGTCCEAKLMKVKRTTSHTVS